MNVLTGERGPITVAAFMERALYDPEHGYYARVAQRTGRSGDFFTSVDVGSLFGELLEVQLAEMATLLASSHPEHLAPFDLVEAGASTGRLSGDILRSARRAHPGVYDRLRLHLVEASPAARAKQRDTLGEVADRLVSSSSELPDAFEGVLLANELLDALPTHQVVMRADGLREVYVAVEDDPPGVRNPRLVTREGPPSTPALEAYLQRIGVRLEPGFRAELNLRAVDWVRDVARRLRRGFAILVDYGHEARELYAASHAHGTLTSYTRHQSTSPEAHPGTPTWLLDPGEQDITAHVDFTSVRLAAEESGLQVLGFLDQTYFLLGLSERLNFDQGHAALNGDGAGTVAALKRRLALRTLLMPGGLGSTHKVMLLGKGMGTPALTGCSYRVRVT